MRKPFVSFEQLREANVARVGQLKGRNGQPAHTEPDGSDWSPTDWYTAAQGEFGELGNLLKKLRRGDFNIYDEIDQAAYPKEHAQYEFYKVWIEAELCGALIYMDLLAHRLGIDLGYGVVQEFNRVSNRIGCDVKMAKLI